MKASSSPTLHSAWLQSTLMVSGAFGKKLKGLEDVCSSDTIIYGPSMSVGWKNNHEWELRGKTRQ